MIAPRLAPLTLLSLLGCTGPVVASPGDETSSSTDPGTTVDPSTSTSTGHADPPPDAESGVASSTARGADESSSGATAICGDGVVEGDETCDDGNTEDGDACRFDCQLAFEVLGTDSYHAATEGVFSVVVDDEGVAWMAGGVRVPGEATDPLVLAYLPVGGFSTAWRPGTAGEDSLSAIALHPSGDLLVTGSVEVGDDRDGTLARFAFPDPPRMPDVLPVWSLAYDGPDEGSEIANRDFAHDVAVDAQGQVYAAYSSREPGEGTDIRITKYDPDGIELWSWGYGGAGQDDDFPRKLVLAPNGDVLFGGVSVESGGGESGILGRVSPQGEPLAIETDLPEEVFSLDADGDGVTAAGIRWIERRTAMLDRVVFSDTDPGFDVAYGIRAFEGGVVVAGGLGVPGEQYNAFVGAWTFEGEVVWTDTYGHESGLNDVARDVAFGPDGTLFVVGTEEVIGEDDNVFVRRYALP